MNLNVRVDYLDNRLIRDQKVRHAKQIWNRNLNPQVIKDRASVIHIASNVWINIFHKEKLTLTRTLIMRGVIAFSDSKVYHYHK